MVSPIKIVALTSILWLTAGEAAIPQLPKQAKPAPGVLFTGANLPSPSTQEQTWSPSKSRLPEKWGTAVAELRRHRLADPRRTDIPLARRLQDRSQERRGDLQIRGSSRRCRRDLRRRGRQHAPGRLHAGGPRIGPRPAKTRTSSPSDDPCRPNPFSFRTRQLSFWSQLPEPKLRE
jgi:hypothetical protein